MTLGCAMPSSRQARDGGEKRHKCMLPGRFVTFIAASGPTMMLLTTQHCSVERRGPGTIAKVQIKACQ